MKTIFTCPGASPYAKLKRVILKSDLYTGHGNIGKNNKINRYGKKEQVIDPALPDQLSGHSPGPPSHR